MLFKHRANIRLRFHGVKFYATRVTDIWLWEAREHHAYQLLVEDLRETTFCVENAYAKNYNRAAIAA